MNLNLKHMPDELLGLVDKDMLRDLLQSFTEATGLTANIVTVSGRSIFDKEDAQNISDFCRIIRNLENAKGINRCEGAYERAGKQAVLYDEPYIFRCPAGLVEWIAPIVLEDIHIGSIVCGQVLMWESEEFFWVELEKMNKEITDDMGPLFEAAENLQVIKPDRVQAASKLLALVANIIVQTIWEKIKKEDELEYQHGLLQQEIKTREDLEYKFNPNSTSYQYEQEQSLFASLEKDDFQQAQRIFKVILGDIIYEDSSVSLVRLKLMDFFSSLSRFHVRNGADQNFALELNLEFISSIRFTNRRDHMGDLAQDCFIKHLRAIRSYSNPSKKIVNDMRNYIHLHYKNNPSIEDVAASVELSPYYASHIFKDDQDIAINEYITKLKIDEAKRMLSNSKNRIEEIARSLGYKDASYFSRVFKKQEGLTPSEYRINN